MSKCVIDIKNTLKKLDNEENWLKAAHYLYNQWQTQQSDFDLIVLLIQQMMMYILDIDNGCLQELHFNNNGLKENREIFQRYLIVAVERGLSYSSKSKYFLWQMCYYLKYISTYYPLLSVPSVNSADQCYHSLLKEAMAAFPNSMLFCLMDRYDSNSLVISDLNEQELRSVLSEINDFHLQDNQADLVAKDCFENVYGIIIE